MKHSKSFRIFTFIGIVCLYVVVKYMTGAESKQMESERRVEQEQSVNERVDMKQKDSQEIASEYIEQSMEEIECKKSDGYNTDEEVVTDSQLEEAIEPENNTETEGNAGALSDNSGSEDLLNNIAIEEEQSITEQEVTEPEFIVEDIPEKTMYAQSDCNIRKGPSTKYDRAGSLSKAQKVTVNGKVTYKDKTWYILKTSDGTEKFVASSLLGTTKPSSDTNKNSNTSSSNSNSSSSNANKNEGYSSSSSSSILDQDPFASPDDNKPSPKSGDTNDGKGGNWRAE